MRQANSGVMTPMMPVVLSPASSPSLTASAAAASAAASESSSGNLSFYLRQRTATVKRKRPDLPTNQSDGPTVDHPTLRLHHGHLATLPLVGLQSASTDHGTAGQDVHQPRLLIRRIVPEDTVLECGRQKEVLMPTRQIEVKPKSSGLKRPPSCTSFDTTLRNAYSATPHVMGQSFSKRKRADADINFDRLNSDDAHPVYISLLKSTLDDHILSESRKSELESDWPVGPCARVLDQAGLAQSPETMVMADEALEELVMPNWTCQSSFDPSNDAFACDSASISVVKPIVETTCCSGLVSTAGSSLYASSPATCFSPLSSPTPSFTSFSSISSSSFSSPSSSSSSSSSPPSSSSLSSSFSSSSASPSSSLLPLLPFSPSSFPPTFAASFTQTATPNASPSPAFFSVHKYTCRTGDDKTVSPSIKACEFISSSNDQSNQTVRAEMREFAETTRRDANTDADANADVEVPEETSNIVASGLSTNSMSPPSSYGLSHQLASADIAWSAALDFPGGQILTYYLYMKVHSLYFVCDDRATGS
ncbi:unnamed protein product [Protopolystoma xenopodis]|uniref:Uncharacterized protein n=1 Tax=Protopolystoma xenopodis TaxID=117903 RepID=A0A3S5BSL5_9PLAT|nr:unnamed protein product [Protopolystoma xenopodis]